jgi:hypothetical protein
MGPIQETKEILKPTLLRMKSRGVAEVPFANEAGCLPGPAQHVGQGHFG